MNSNHTRLVGMVALLLGVSLGAVRATDWTTSDGKTYQEVKLVHLDEDTVTILDKDGGARIPLAKLSPDLQKRFGYDPSLAQAAADARAKEAALDAQALQAEMDKASAMHQAGKDPATAATSDPTATSDEATGSVTAETSQETSPAAHSGTHHFMDEIAVSASGQATGVAATSHHSIDEATQTASAMRRELSDPAYHTVAHLFYTVRTTGLGPDTNDSSHHTIGETTAAASQQK